MKVLILANNDVGLYQFRKELIQELLKKNMVYISLPYGKLVEPLKKMGCQYIDTSVDRRGINPLTDIKLFLKYVSMIRKIKPDLVVTYTIKPNVYGGIVCRILHIPYAVNITGLGTAFQKEGLLRRIVTIMYRIGLKRAKVVFFENGENFQMFVKNKVVKRRQACQLNGAGVNVERYHLAEYPDGDITKYLFIGRVMKEKGIEELFTAMHMLYKDGEQVQLDVLGDYEEDYKEIINRYQSEGWLKYHGYQVDVKPFIHDSHCFVLPSWHEGMANTNLECASSGRPVITSNIHGCLEAVEDGVSGYLCECRNSQDLYQKMKTFVGLSYAERKQMGLAGRKRMEMCFDKRQVVAKTLSELYK
ncbi:glycosyltransferase family 4 protein [Dorea sp. YH-dor226]|uniref:glycosyltransferase family 4 protein n=1 Tax=Dorea sp. YH-dor226 TaxID=3151119 RepID=UPI00324212F7